MYVKQETPKNPVTDNDDIYLHFKREVEVEIASSDSGQWANSAVDNIRMKLVQPILPIQGGEPV